MKYYWLIITILFVIKVLKGKELSSYNTKWMFFYVIYVLLLYAEYFYYHEQWDEMLEEFIILTFLIPTVVYIAFPFAWKYIGKLKVFKQVEDLVDKVYTTIKNS